MQDRMAHQMLSETGVMRTVWPTRPVGLSLGLRPTAAVGAIRRSCFANSGNTGSRGGCRTARRAAICWVRQVQRQCKAVAPRPCAAFLATDSDEVPPRATAFFPVRNQALCPELFLFPAVVRSHHASNGGSPCRPLDTPVVTMRHSTRKACGPACTPLDARVPARPENVSDVQQDAALTQHRNRHELPQGSRPASTNTEIVTKS